MNQQILIAHIIDTAKKAESQLEPCNAGCRHFTVPQVRVIGGESLEFMTVLVDKTIEKAKRILAPTFGLEGLLLILLLALL
jgi:predicted neutral ceramidase superfamily lipid hydrolase